MTDQLDLFQEPRLRPSAAALRQEEFYGKMDARCGMPLVEHYSRQLSGVRLEAYERGFRAERQRQIAEAAGRL